MKRTLVLGTLLLAGALSIGVRSQTALNPGAVSAAEIEQVRGNLYVITGSSPIDRATFSGGNVGVFVSDEGVTVVDTKLQRVLSRIGGHRCPREHQSQHGKDGDVSR